MSIKVMTWAWGLDIEARDKLVLMALADHSDDDGICWPGIKGVAQKNRISERAVQRHMANLQGLGLLVVLPQYRPDGSRATNLYRLALTVASPPGVKIATPGDSADDVTATALVTRASPPGDTGVTALVTRASPLEPSLEPSENHQSLIEIEGDKSVWPDWYATLYAIPGFKRPFKEAEAWRIVKGISKEHAEITAYALKGKWTAKQYPDAWATFQNWCTRPAFASAKPTIGANNVNGAKGTPEGLAQLAKFGSAGKT